MWRGSRGWAAALGAFAMVAGLAASAGTAHALCAIEPQDLFRDVQQSDASFIGTAQPGPNDGVELLSPATFSVEHWLGGRRAPVATAGVLTRLADVYEEDGVPIRAGERWLIVGTGPIARLSPGCGGLPSELLDDETGPRIDPAGDAPARRGVWSTPKGEPLTEGERPPRVARAASYRVPGVGAARLVSGSKSTRLTVRGSRVLLPAGSTGNRLVVATATGFWTVTLRR